MTKKVINDKENLYITLHGYFLNAFAVVNLLYKTLCYVGLKGQKE